MQISPLQAFRFKIASQFPHIDSQTESVSFDFVNKTITLMVRQASVADGFIQAMNFAARPLFDVEALSGGGEPSFGVKPLGLELTDHSLVLGYAINDAAKHRFVFSYSSLVTGSPVNADDIVPIPTSTDFPPVGELDLSDYVEFPEDPQEARMTPDDPDRDGDGVVDSKDAYPDDPTRS